jgi:DNA-binding transcriptional ArsR family regulator
MTTKATGWTFSQVPIWLLCNHDISDGAKVLFAYLKYRQGTDAACWPSRETIASDIGIAQSTVTRRLKELEDAGYIKRHFRDGTSTLYEMIADPPGEQERWAKMMNDRQRAKQGRNSIPCSKTIRPPAQKRSDPLLKNDQHDDSHERESKNDTSADAENSGKEEKTGDDLLDEFGIQPAFPENRKKQSSIDYTDKEARDRRLLEATVSFAQKHMDGPVPHPWSEWGQTSDTVKDYLERVSPQMAHKMLEAGYKLEMQMMFEVPWGDKSKLKSWMHGLKVCLEKQGATPNTLIEAARLLVTRDMIVSEPHQLEKTVAGLCTKKRLKESGMNVEPKHSLAQDIDYS